MTATHAPSAPSIPLSSLLASEAEHPGAWLLPGNLPDEKLALLHGAIHFAFRQGRAVEGLVVDRTAAQWMIRDLLLAHLRSAYHAGFPLPLEVENVAHPPFRISSEGLVKLLLRLQAEVDLERHARDQGFHYERATEKTFLHERCLSMPHIPTPTRPH